MIINVNKISEKGITYKNAFTPDTDTLLEEQSYFQEGIAYQIVLQREGRNIRAKGKIKTMVALPCVRCLEHFDLKIHSQFDVILFPLELLDPRNSALDPEVMEYIFYENNQIDLEKILIEQVNLFIPLNPVCQPLCKGICPNCGVNLNREICQCEEGKREIQLIFEKDKR